MLWIFANNWRKSYWRSSGTSKKDDNDQEVDGNGNNEVLDDDMRSLSLNELNYDQNVLVQDEDEEEEDNSSSQGEGESEEEGEGDGYLFVDLWENLVNTDPDSANELQELIGDVLNKCRSTIKMINKSSNLTLYMDNLKDINDIENSLSIDCKSRWNSTKYMIQNILKFKSLIAQLHSDKYDLHLTNKRKQKLTNLELSTDEWLMINSIEQVLIPFEKATKLMSGQKYPAIGTALFALRKIKVYFESYVENNTFINEMKSLLLEQMVHYIDDDTEQLDLIIFLAYFDPLGFSVLTQKERTTVERKIKELLKDLHNDTQNSDNNQVGVMQTSSSSTLEATEDNRSTSKSTFSIFLKSISTSSTKRRSTHATTNNISIADEFLLYKSIANKEVQNIIESELNPDASAFWRTFGNQLPQLKLLAKRYLCTPATLVPSESAFSIASNLGRRQRARLHPSTLSMTVFLKDKVNDV